MPMRLFMRIAAAALAAAVALGSGQVATARSTATIPSRALIVRLDGRSATVPAAAKNHCHDAVKGTLECFSSASARDAAWQAIRLSQPLSPASNGYVIAWVGATYTGASVVLTQDYANLTTIGWNDRISAYKVYTNLTGAFYEHSNYWGLTQFFCCFSQVSYVGNAYNDRFSSIDLP